MKFSKRMLVLEILALIVLLILGAAGFLAWRLTKGPLDMNVLRPQVEAALTEARGGQPVKIDSLLLAWSPDKRRIEATIGGITTFNSENQVHAEAEKGAVWFDTVALMQGRINVVKVRLENGSSALHRDSNGVWSLVSPEENFLSDREKLPEETEKTSPDAFDWRSWIPQFRGHVEQQSFQTIEFSNFDFRITDSITGLDWKTIGAEGNWQADTEGLLLDVSGDLLGDDAPQALQLRLFSDNDIENFSVELGVVGADPERLAALAASDDFPVRYDGVVDLNIGATASERDGILTAQFSAAGEGGSVRIEGKDQPYMIESFSFETLADFKTRDVTLTQLNLKSDNLAGEFEGQVNLAQLFNGSETPEYPFSLKANDAWLKIQPMFDRPWDILEADITGTIDTENMSILFEKVSGGVENFRGTGTGRVYLEPKLPLVEGQEEKSLGKRIGVEVKAVGEGRVTPDQVFGFWPLKLGSDARNWAKDNILDGRGTNINFFMDFPPGTNSKQIVPDKALTLDFRVEGAKVKFLSDLPPISDAAGVGRLRGNSMTIKLESGRFGEWELDEGSADLPAFHPAGAISVYTASGRGDLKDLMDVLEGSRLKVCSEYELECSEMKGSGGLDVEIKRPMGANTTAEDILFDVKGGFLETEVPELAFGFGLVNSDVTVDLDNEALELQGAGRFGSAPAEFTWIQDLDERGNTSLKANAVVTPDLFNSLGLAARSFMQGEADLELEASGRKNDFDSIEMHFDLTGAALNLSEIGWLKPLYVPGTGEFRFGKGATGESVLTGDIQAKGVELAGELTFSEETGLQRALIERIYSENRLDLRGDVHRSANGDVQLNVSGPYLDASPWIDGVSEIGKGGQGPGVNVLANISVDKLKLRQDTQLLNSKLVLDMSPESLDRGLVSGTIARGKGIEATFERDGEDILFQLMSDDAGYVIKTLFKTEYLLGGTLSMSGVLGKELGTAEMNMKDVRLKGAPILAQVFALASLRGLTDVLNGDGVLFTEIEAPLRFKNGRIDFPGIKASGPAMGLTSRGWLHMDTGDISLDGVVVPSFGVNSALGGIPIIGDLFVSRQGEGVFAVTYSVRGALERATVSINPLSAVTPGFLRRLMENPSQTPERTDTPTD